MTNVSAIAWMPSTTSSSRDTQLVDVLAVERRDERVLEPAVDLVVDLVAALLEAPGSRRRAPRAGRTGRPSRGARPRPRRGSRRRRRTARRTSGPSAGVGSSSAIPPVVRGGDGGRSSGDPERVAGRPRRAAARMPAAGMVRTQATRMRRATPQRTPRAPWLEPTPMIALEMTWVVETGIPKWAVANRIDGGRRLGGEAVDRLELGDALAHRLHDPPAADRGPERQRRGRHDDDPGGTVDVGDDAGREQGEGDDAHRLLGVVGAVGEGHERRREDLQPAEAAAPSACAATAGRSSRSRASARTRSTKPRSGEVNIGMRTLLTIPSMLRAPVPAADDRRAEQAADERVAARARQAQLPGDEVPGDRADEGGRDDGLGRRLRRRPGRCRSSWRRPCRRTRR